MTDTSPTTTQTVVVAPSRLSWKDLVPVVMLILTLITLLVGGGKVLGKVDDNTRRISLLEQRAERRDDELGDLKARIAGMDAKLDLLINRTSRAR